LVGLHRGGACLVHRSFFDRVAARPVEGRIGEQAEPAERGVGGRAVDRVHAKRVAFVGVHWFLLVSWGAMTIAVSTNRSGRWDEYNYE
jgi:hypothetical protein